MYFNLIKFLTILVLFGGNVSARQFWCYYGYNETKEDCIRQFTPLLIVGLQLILHNKIKSQGNYIMLGFANCAEIDYCIHITYFEM